MVIDSEPGSSSDNRPLEQALRGMRIVHAFLLVSIVLYVDVAAKVAPHVRPVAPSFIGAISGIAVIVGVVAFIFRSRTVAPAEETLRLNPQDSTALRRWRAGQITSLALAESVVLDGFVLRFVGAEWRVAGLFFVAGAALMLLFTPRRP